MRTWIVVADAAKARLYQVVAPGELRLLLELENPEGRAKSRDWLDESGELQRAEGWEKRGAMEPLSIKKVEAQRFARHLATLLEKGVDEHRYDRLILAAAPEFLGMIRRELPDKVERRVYDAIAKDYVNDQDGLERRLSLTHNL